VVTGFCAATPQTAQSVVGQEQLAEAACQSAAQPVPAVLM